VHGDAFRLDRFEVTNARYASCVAAGACKAPSLSGSKTRARYVGEAAFAEYPVIFVSWFDAVTFCKWAGGRLPTEAEWERSARGTETPRTFPWGNDAPTCDKANFAGCVGDTDQVGKRPAGSSPYGALDMAGNVWEWTADFYAADYYSQSPVDNPKGPASGSLKVMRGGCWVSGADSLRSTCRKAELPSLWAPNVGFRCAYDQENR
jgi:formylglycine-generating enzyme required for sulfatase activity